MSKKQQTHCRHCGAELFDFQAEAENVKVHTYASMDSMYGVPLDSKFDAQGERNYATVWQCPNYGDKPWYLKWQVDEHDIFVDYDGEKHIPTNL